VLDSDGPQSDFGWRQEVDELYLAAIITADQRELAVAGELDNFQGKRNRYLAVCALS
jgi:hypothetical protein